MLLSVEPKSCTHTLISAVNYPATTFTVHLTSEVRHSVDEPVCSVGRCAAVLYTRAAAVLEGDGQGVKETGSC